jgi:thioredoxin-dependent peroxiredoxin
LEKLGAQVLGMSGDSPERLAKFHEKYHLNFLLAGDPSHKTLEAYGVWQEKSLYGKKSMGIVRTTYLLDAQGRVTHVFPKVKVEGHAQAVLEALRA